MTITSRYTPSILPRETLEATFAVRERLLEAIDARIGSAVATPSRNHSLLVGPRGSGKTHLVSLVYYRCLDRIQRSERLQVAWLPEDPWTLTSYDRLLQAILQRLEPNPSPPIAKLDHARLEATVITSATDAGPIVVIVENLDRLLSQLGDAGQQHLRHLLQDPAAPLLMVGSTTRLDRTLADQAAPFYGFFTTTRLEPFGVDDARRMLTALATAGHDSELARRVDDSVSAIPRLRTIEHLAGGQPRMWSILARGLTVSGVREFAEELLTAADELTPYYQEQLARLSPHQRLIVAELSGLDHPMHVAELSAHLDIDQRSLSKSISDLVDRGWIAPVTVPYSALLDKRRTYYELAEPLARIAFQIKETRGQPPRLVIDFLTSWFDPDEVSAVSADNPHLRAADAAFGTNPTISVIRHLSQLPIGRAPSAELLGHVDDALAALGEHDPAPLLRLPAAIRTVIDSELASESAPIEQAICEIRRRIHEAALAEMGNVPSASIDAWIPRAEQLVSSSGEYQLILHDWLTRAWRFDDALAMTKALSILRGDNHPDTLTAYGQLAEAYTAAGDLPRGTSLFERVLEGCQQVLGADHPATAMARSDLAVAHHEKGDFASAVTLHEETLSQRERILGREHRDTLSSRDNLAVSLLAIGDWRRASPMLEQTLADRERLLGQHHPDTLRSLNNLAGAREAAGDLAGAVRLYEEALSRYDRSWGRHPQALIAGSNLAGAFRELGDLPRAVSLYEKLLLDAERELGGTHPSTLLIRMNLASACFAIGDVDRAGEMSKQTLLEARRVLRPGHPWLRAFTRAVADTNGTGSGTNS